MKLENAPAPLLHFAIDNSNEYAIKARGKYELNDCSVFAIPSALEGSRLLCKFELVFGTRVLLKRWSIFDWRETHPKHQQPV